MTKKNEKVKIGGQDYNVFVKSTRLTLPKDFLSSEAYESANNLAVRVVSVEASRVLIEVIPLKTTYEPITMGAS